MKNNKSNAKPKYFYDRFYKYIFQNKNFIQALIKFILPDELIIKLNWDTLKTEKTHFVPKDLKSREADVIYSLIKTSILMKL